GTAMAAGQALPDGGVIAYSSAHINNDSEIYLLDIHRGLSSNLTKHRAADCCPSWSPDGQNIAFASNRAGSWDFYVMKLNGDDVQRLPILNTSGRKPTWSPDGRHIAYAVQDHVWRSVVYVTDVSGSATYRLTQNGNDSSPSWSPDGQQIAFASQLDGNTHIYRIGPDGKHQQRLSDGNLSAYVYYDMPTWSPDGRFIAFVTWTSDGGWEVAVMDADGGHPRVLTHNEAFDGYPAWSPDGGQIAFLSNRDGTFEIYLMDANGNHQRRITRNEWAEFFPTWRP
ncbi:MAG: hypothetical protein L0Z53_13000, partial [Acidobacteriales bacterium]|nr:hypothetical protein [Terriglobales bacterium]